MNVNFVTPCLLFSKIAFSLSAGMGMLAFILPTSLISLRRVFGSVDHPSVFHSHQWRILGGRMDTCCGFRTQPPAKVVSVLTFLAIFFTQHFMKKLRYGCCHDHELEFPPSRASPIAGRFSARARTGSRRYD